MAEPCSFTPSQLEQKAELNADDDAISTLPSKAEVQLDLFKTSLCSYFRKANQCRHGDQCNYAHGEDELRPRPDGSWDPTSERGKRSLDVKQEVDEHDDYVFSELEEDAGNLGKCISGLPLRWSSDDLKKLLVEQGVAFRSSKKRKRFHVGFVQFESEEQIALAKEKLDGLRVHSKQLKVADVLTRAWENKKCKNKAGFPTDVECGTETTGKPTDICEVVTPLGKLPYQQQLERKRDEIARVLKKLVRNVRKAVSPNVSLPAWITEARVQGGLCCPFHGIIESPIIDGYRNKCEFTIGNTSDGRRVVGFLLGNFREGCNFVSEPNGCRNVSYIAQSYARAFQEFVQKSELPAWDKSINAGFWRLFMVREGRAASVTTMPDNENITEVMLVVQVCSANVEEGIRAREYERMAGELAVFASQAFPPLALTTLIVQDHLGISNAASPDSPLITIPIPKVVQGSAIEDGEKVSATFIHDHICNLRFRVSANAFFQVNTLAAEKLYNLAGDWAGLSSDTLLFDVCCGTGTIGLTLAHKVGMVVGIEMNASAIADARTNAEINGINNCQFVCGKAEDVMDSLLEEYLLDEDRSDELQSLSSENSIRPAFPGGLTVAEQDAVKIQGGDVRKEANGFLQEASCEGPLAFDSKEKFSSVVVIVDPPRSGLHPMVIKVLRTHEQIHRLVYVSCNPETLLANAVELCTPTVDGEGEAKANSTSNASWRHMSVVGHARKRMKFMPVSKPFRPVKAVAVDMFPHTPHCEVVMLMER